MLPILLLTMAQTPPPMWTFKDELARDGRPMATFRAVELGDIPPRPLHADDKPPAGAKFGDLRLGPGGASRRLIVWHAETGALWLDGDGDGRFAESERHTLGTDPLEVRIPFPAADSKETRTVILKRRGDGLASAVRGYMEGTVKLGGQTYAAQLTDGDADGCFDSAAADRIWIDLDRDGEFDPLTEQFPLGAPLAHRGSSYLLKPDAAGTRVEVRERPAEAGTVRLKVTRVPGSRLLELNAQLVSEWGELVTVGVADKPNPLPVGRYRVEAVRLRLKDADGREWMYRLYGPAHPVLTVAKDRETAFDVSGGVRIDIGLGTGRGGVKAGDGVRVRPDVVTKAGLAMAECEVSEVGTGSGRPARAAVRLTGPGSAVVDEVEAQFL